ncbi:Glycosyltransferase [Rhodopirellula islandica]|uniref:Glycosyltransferase n=1 Tax=Rhodopirellula islandica TaxID=595434 RepID=A0A0J1B6U3_RHOIS|nr:glycosyltransferase family 4 protein [Rhodopirellula islandica]KLU02545.1 Glycosyltransferase [Rhodopirellula islandica]
MRILIHDFGGYPFPIELSRELASRGNEVMHAYCGSIKTTPGGEHQKAPDDSETLEVMPVLLPETLDKYSFVKRWRQENHYGMLVSKLAKKYAPDVVVSANTPLDAQRRLVAACKTEQVPFVFWLQDVLGVATDKLLRKKIPVVGKWIGRHYLNMERSLLQQSDWNVLITEDFLPLAKEWELAEQKVTVIENWAPIHRLPPCDKRNQWSVEKGLDDKRCLIYTGTMGMKHNPGLLLRLASSLQQEPDTRVVVVSEGLGAEWLKQKAREQQLDNLLVYDYTPFEQVPDVMGTADILIAVLEPDAGLYSVPSKVLAYLCAGRSVLLSVPLENLAARTVVSANAGLVHPPGADDEFVESAMSLLSDEDMRMQLGRNGRFYAEQHFDIKQIADRFTEGIERIVHKPI